MHRLRQIRKGGGDATGLSGKVADFDDERLARDQGQWAAAGEAARANLRAAQILQDGDLTTSGGRVANALNHGSVRAVRTVGKIQTKNIDTCPDKRANDLVTF